MKTIALILSLLVAGSTAGFAQCGKKFTINTIKTDHLDSKGNITRTDAEEKAVVVVSATEINITVNEDHKMSGPIKSNDCNWTVPFKEGKSVIKTVITGDNGDAKNVTITITGKDGKVNLLFEAEDEPDDRISVTVAKFEESV